MFQLFLFDKDLLTLSKIDLFEKTNIKRLFIEYRLKIITIPYELKNEPVKKSVRRSRQRGIRTQDVVKDREQTYFIIFLCFKLSAPKIFHVRDLCIQRENKF